MEGPNLLLLVLGIVYPIASLSLMRLTSGVTGIPTDDRVDARSDMFRPGVVILGRAPPIV